MRALMDHLSKRVDHQAAERGQSLVEFAFMLVILLVLLSGIVDAGRALFTYLAMRDAAQEGALYGSTAPTDSAGIIDRVCHSSNMLADLCNDTTNFHVVPSLIGAACIGNGIQVEVRHDAFPLTMPFIGVFIGGQSVPIRATVIDTILTPKCP